MLEWADAEECKAKFLTRPSAILDLWRKYIVFCLADVCEPRCQWRSRLSVHSAGNAKRMKKSTSQRHASENRLPTQEQLQVVCVVAYSGARCNLKGTGQSKLLRTTPVLLCFIGCWPDKVQPAWPSCVPMSSLKRPHRRQWQIQQPVWPRWVLQRAIPKLARKMHVYTRWQWSGQLWHNLIIIYGFYVIYVGCSGRHS